MFLQAIIRQAKAIGLCSKYLNREDDPETHQILKKIIALALLPAEKIEEGLKLIEESALKFGEKRDKEAAEEAVRKNKKVPKKSFLVNWKRFFKYMRDEWMKKVKPKYLSLFNVFARTNNVLERWHRYLNDEMGGKPGVQHFISKCTQLINDCMANFFFVRVTF